MSAVAQVAGNQLTEVERFARRQRSLIKVFGERFAETFSSPVLFIDDQVLRSPVATRFFHKDFAYLSKQLYLEYQYRSWKGYNQELLTRYAELVGKKLENIKILMTNNVSRMRNLLSQQGYSLETTLWTKSIDIDVPVIAAQARTYWEMLLLLEQVYVLTATANYFGVFSSSQREIAETQCKRAIRAFRSVLQTEVVKLYREADRLIKEQHSSGNVDKGMAAMVEQQGKDIAEFDASDADDARSDASLDLGGVDAGQLIDDAAAASTAGAAASKRVKKPRTASSGGAEHALPAAAAAAVGAADLAADATS
jgi:hypothetical protein